LIFFGRLHADEDLIPAMCLPEADGRRPGKVSAGLRTDRKIDSLSADADGIGELDGQTVQEKLLRMIEVARAFW